MDLRGFFTSQIWWGKILCAFLGFLLAGPIGAFFGIFVGNFFDRGLTQYINNPFWHFHVEKRQSVKKLFFQATFTTLGYIAKADGRVSHQDIQMANTIMQHMKLNAAQQTVAQRYFNEGKNAHVDLQKLIKSFNNASINNPNLLQLFINTQYTAALLDGLSDNKIQRMNTILHYMNRAPIQQQSRFHHDFNQKTTTRNNTNNTLSGAYAILQVSHSSSKQDIKKAYRRLISVHHPDKLIAKGASNDAIKMANEKTQIIRKAYEQICASKGW